MATKSTTTKKTPTLVERIEVSEQAYAGQAERAKGEHAALAEVLANHERQIEEAEEKVHDVKAAIRSGDESVEVSDLANAEKALEFATLARDGAATRLSRLVKQMHVNTQTDAATALIPAIKRALPSVPVHVTAAPLPEIIETDAPLVIVRQTGDSCASDGTMLSLGRVDVISGRPRREPGVPVEVHYFRGAIHRTLTAEALGGAIRDLEIRAEAHVMALGANTLTGDIEQDSIRLNVAEAAPVPAIVNLDESKANHVAEIVSRAVTADKGGARGKSDLSSVKTTVNGGIRSTVLTGTCEVRQRPGSGKPEAGTMTMTSPSDRTKREEARSLGLHGNRARLSDVDRIDRCMFAGLGRVTGLDIENNGEGDYRWTARLVSRTGFEVPTPSKAEPTNGSRS